MFAAWVLSLASTFGALFIGEVMGKVPCNLCWHQRAFMFPLSVILAVACYRNDAGVVRYAMPLALIGGLIAGFHTLHYTGVIPETIKPCGQGPSCSSADMAVLGLPLPTMSLLAFCAITGLLFLARRNPPHV